VAATTINICSIIVYMLPEACSSMAFSVKLLAIKIVEKHEVDTNYDDHSRAIHHFHGPEINRFEHS
jgi:hypothetical protein